MKEHAFFLLAGFPEKEEAFRQETDRFRGEFEELLEIVVKSTDGM